MKHKLHKKGSVPLSFFSVNVTKSVRNCGLVSFTEEILSANFIFCTEYCGKTFHETSKMHTI